jgi:hypothetical protein
MLYIMIPQGQDLALGLFDIDSLDCTYEIHIPFPSINENSAWSRDFGHGLISGLAI